MKHTHNVSFTFVLIILTAACTPAGSTQPTITPEPTATAQPTSTFTPIPTPTPMLPVAMVGGMLHCFDEPSLESDMVTIIDIGMQAEVVGQSHDSLFWLVKPDEEVDPCWLEARYTTVINLDNQEIAKIQPTPTSTPEPPTVPPAPENISAVGGCDRVGFHYEVTYKLNWDPGDKISGYTVYRNGQVLANLDGMETEFADWFNLEGKQTGVLIYSIQARNEVGDSEPAEISVQYECKAK